jgi:hypothetical protein
MEDKIRNCPHTSAPIKINNLDLAAAKRFHGQMARSFRLPPFDFSKNNGIPLSILYDISFSTRKYGVHTRISRLARTKAQRTTLLMLTILLGVLQDAEELYSITQEAKLPFDIRNFIESDLVEQRGSQIHVSHPVISDFVLAEYRGDLPDLLSRLLPTLKRRAATAYLYLRLRFADLLGTDLEESDWQCLIQTLVSATTTYEVNALIYLLPWASAIADKMPDSVRYICDFIVSQNSIYHYEFDAGRLTSYSAPIDVVTKQLLQLQSLYHKNRFAQVVAMASSEAMRGAVAELQTTDQQTWALSIREALLGVSYIALGQHAPAKEAIASASRLSPASSLRGQYLRLLDDFVFGEDFLSTHHFISRNDVRNNYIRAKNNHNIFASKISAGLLNERSAEEFLINVIEPFSSLQSQEITYCYNNLAVLHIAQGNIDLALEHRSCSGRSEPNEIPCVRNLRCNILP